MTRWTAFAGFTGLILAFLLLLARASATGVSELRDDSADRDFGAPAERDADTEQDTHVSAEQADRVDGHSPPEGGRPAVEAAAVEDFASAHSRDARRVPPGGDPESERPREARPTSQEVIAERWNDAELSPGMLVVNVAFTQGLFGVLLLASAWYTEVPLDALGVTGAALSTGLPALGVGLGLGLLLAVANEGATRVADAFEVGYSEDLRRLLAPESLRGWVLLLGVALPIVAGVEELLFRAALIGAFSAGFGISPWLLAVVSSVAFALGHGAQGRVGMVVTGVLGVVFAVAFVLTGSLLAVVVAHYLVNAVEFVRHEGPWSAE